jgi:hypothetical protein
MEGMKERLAPFLMLLEARYAPLLFAVAPQAYAVYLWLMPQPYDGTGEFFAVMGGIGYEFIYVGAIAWAEEERWSFWTWATAVIALLFSMAVAYYVYRAQGYWAWLHAGFPLVAFGYTMNMHAPTVRMKVVESKDDSATLTKTAQVKALMLSEKVSESTAWRRVKAAELSMNGKEH